MHFMIGRPKLFLPPSDKIVLKLWVVDAFLLNHLQLFCYFVSPLALQDPFKY